MMESNKNTIQLVEFSHHDLGWHKMGYEEEADFTDYEIDLALDIMNKDEEYKFCWTHEHAAYIYQYLMNRGERYEELKQRVLEGRFEIGTGYTSPYTAFISAELLARQMIYGKKWIETMFPGYVPQVYYNTDVPSLTKQFPQILAKSGTDYLYLSRSWNFDNFKQNEFLKWYSPDGTGIKTHFMHHYGDNVWEDKTVPYVEKRVPDYNYNLPMLLIAMDCTPPNDLAQLMKDWAEYREAEENKEKNLPSLKYNTYQKAIENIFSNNEFPFSLSGEWPNKWLYENDGSDYNCFLDQKEAQSKLSMAEMLGVLLAVKTNTFEAYETGLFEKAWRYAEHSCHGFAPERPMEEFRRRYKLAHEMAENLLQKYGKELADGITPCQEGIPVCVFHMGGKKAESVISVTIPEALQHCNELEVRLGDGTICPSQKRENGTVSVKMELASVGFNTIYMSERKESKQTKNETTIFENEYYRLELGSLGISKLFDKENNKELFQNEKFYAGEMVIMNYDGMGAGEHLNIWQPDSENYNCVFRDHPLVWNLTESGDVCNVYQATSKLKEATITLTVTAFHQMKKIDFDVDVTELTIEDKKQIRFMFPMREGKTVYEVPFGESTVGSDEVLKKFGKFNPNKGNFNNTNHDDNTGVRPREVQNYISCTDKDGFEVLISTYNVPWDYQDPTKDPLENPVLQPVLLSTSKACHWLYGHWSQSDDRHYHFSIMSEQNKHEELCARAKREYGMVWSTVSAANKSLFEGDTYQFMNLDTNDIQITAIKKAEERQDGYIVRVYNTTENQKQAELLFGENMKDFCSVNMIEQETGNKVSLDENQSMNLTLTACEIANFLIRPEGMKDSKQPPKGIVAAVTRTEGEEKHPVVVRWIADEGPEQYTVLLREEGMQEWTTVASVTENKAELKLADGRYELCVKKEASVMSCPIELKIRKAPKVELPEA